MTSMLTLWRLQLTWCLVALVALLITSPVSAQAPDDAFQLVQQLGKFPAAIMPGGAPVPLVEQQREPLYRRLRGLGESAMPA